MTFDTTPNATYNNAELAIMRRQTRLYIEDAGILLTLTPYAEVRTAAGGKVRTAQMPRAPQLFRVLSLSRSVTNTTVTQQSTAQGRTNDGVQRESEFQLLAEHNAEIERGDRFTLNGDEYEVVEIPPSQLTPYQRRAVCRGVPSGT